MAYFPYTFEQLNTPDNDKNLNCDVGDRKQWNTYQSIVIEQ